MPDERCDRTSAREPKPMWAGRVRRRTKRAAIAFVVGCLTGAAPALAQTSSPAAPPSPPSCGVAATTTSDAVLGASTSPGGSLMAAQFGGGVGFYPVEGTAPLPSSSPPGVEIALGRVASRTTTETPLALEVEVHNRTSSPVRVMRALDGSLEHWRDPHWDLFLRDEATGTLYRWDFHGGRCGNVNPIVDEDVRTIAPRDGDDTLPGGWASYVRQAVIPVPGRYSVWLAYRYCGAASHGLPLGPNAVVPSMLQGVFVSNPVQIEVVASAGSSPPPVSPPGR
ncbi:MAG: hypothetical protein AB8I08_08660 [Sandaracinaceae bacterium]